MIRSLPAAAPDPVQCNPLRELTSQRNPYWPGCFTCDPNRVAGERLPQWPANFLKQPLPGRLQVQPFRVEFEVQPCGVAFKHAQLLECGSFPGRVEVERLPPYSRAAATDFFRGPDSAGASEPSSRARSLR